MNNSEYVKYVDSGIYMLTNIYFTTLYGTDWYKSTVKPHMIDYTKDANVSKVYKAFLQKNKETLTEEDAEVCMNLMFNDFDLGYENKSDNLCDKEFRDSFISEFEGKKEKLFAEEFRKLFEIRNNCVFNPNACYHPKDLDFEIFCMDDNIGTYCSIIMDGLKMCHYFDSYNEIYFKKIQHAYCDTLISTLKQYQVDIQLSVDDERVVKKFSYIGNDYRQHLTEINAQLNDSFSLSFDNAMELGIWEIDHLFHYSPCYNLFDEAEIQEFITKTLSQINKSMSARDIHILLSQNIISEIIFYKEDEYIRGQIKHLVGYEEERIKAILDKYKNKNCGSSVYLNIKQKIDTYFARVTEYMNTNRLEDSATNARHILELIVNTYINIFSKEDAFLKTFDKIERLKEKKIISNTSVDSLHRIRKIANKGAHGNSEQLTFDEIKLLLPPLQNEAKILYKVLEAKERKYEKNIDNTDRKTVIDFICATCHRALNQEIKFPNMQFTCSGCNSQYIVKESIDDQGYQVRRIVQCEKCKVSLSVPIRKETCIVDCSRCHYSFQLMPDGLQQACSSNVPHKKKEKRSIFKWRKR